jgi:hypothetical protein
MHRARPGFEYLKAPPSVTANQRHDVMLLGSIVVEDFRAFVVSRR